MLIDATHSEETRVVVMDGTRLEEYEVESTHKKQLKGNVYLAKITRIEPSLQAAFLDYGSDRHGFLPFADIHPDYYNIPEKEKSNLKLVKMLSEVNSNDDDDDEQDISGEEGNKESEKERSHLS